MDYRQISSDDQRAWSLTQKEQKWSWVKAYVILIALSIFIGICFFLFQSP